MFAAILLVVTMAFTGLLNYLAFMDNYRKSQVQSFSVAGNGVVRKIEAALQYGKPLENFYGMSEILREIKEVIPGVTYVNIVNRDGQILYNAEGPVNDQILQPDLLKTANFATGVIDANSSYINQKEYNHIYLKISDAVSPHLASLEMVLPDTAFQGTSGRYLQKLIGYLAIILVIALGCLWFFVYNSSYLTIKDGLNKKRLLILLLVILGTSQILYSGLNYALFKEAYLETASKSAEYLEQLVANNLESIYQKGLTLKEVSGFEEYLAETAATVPGIEQIELNPENSQLQVLTSAAYLNKKMLDILLDMGTVLIIAIFFMIELTLLTTRLLARSQFINSEVLAKEEDTSGLVRALVFIANIGVFMSISFVPIVMNKLYQPIAGLAQDVILGLPISAEMLAGVVAIIMAGRLITERGWKPVFYMGIVFLAVGNMLSGTSGTALTFILSRAIAGWGIGLVMMSLRSLVIMLPGQNKAIAEFSAGAVAGLNCGAVIGGMLSERIGYSNVFYLSALLVFISALFAWRLLVNNTKQQLDSEQISPWDNFRRFSRDGKVLQFLFLFFLPVLVAGVFLSYSFPLLAQAHNLSQGNISRAFLLNGLCIIYLGPPLTVWTTRYLGNKMALLLSSSLIIAGMFLFMVIGNIEAAFALVILLGVADSFGAAAQTSYFLNLEPVRRMGLSRGIGYFSIIVNLGKMLGPIVFGVAFTWGIQYGIRIIAVTLAVFLALFMLTDRNKSDNLKPGAYS